MKEKSKSRRMLTISTDDPFVNLFVKQEDGQAYLEVNEEETTMNLKTQ